MTFQQELRIFFKKHDPDRIILAKSIASKFKSASERKVVLNRLKIVYDNGGPANIVLGDPNNVPMDNAFEIEENQVTLSEDAGSVEVEIDIENSTQEVIIDISDEATSGDDEESEDEDEKDV